MNEVSTDNPSPRPTATKFRFRRRPSTFTPIALDWHDLSQQDDFGIFVNSMYTAVERLKNERLRYYSGQRARRAIVNILRNAMIFLGILALLSTSIAAGIRVSGTDNSNFICLGNWMLAIALSCYVLMSAMSFWETATSSTAAYFRQIQLILGIRDLWTRFEFDFVGALRARQIGQVDENTTKSTLLELARTVVTSIDDLAQGELAEWKQEFLTSISTLNTASSEGIEQIRSDIRASVTQAIERREMGYVSLNIIDGLLPAEVTVDDMQPIETASLSLTLPPLSIGPHRLKVVAKNSSGASKEVSSYIPVPDDLSRFSISMESGMVTKI